MNAQHILATEDVVDVRRWSYGFERVDSSQSAYRPRPPPPRPTSYTRQLSSPDRESKQGT